ncbi:MAG: MFS transporter, partial [Terriglobia bacterium]
GPLTALMTELIPGAHRGSYMAARGVASQLGIGAAVFAGGVFYEHWGYAAVTLFCGLMTGAAAAVLGAWISEPTGSAGDST